VPPLSDDALVVRGGLNTVELLEAGTGVTIDSMGNLHGLSVNSAPGKTVAELAEGLRYGQIGVTTVGAVRAAGGDVTPDPSANHPFHCLAGGISAQTAHRLLTPTVPNPSRVKFG
jgi:hypothetical protein